jgi:hypothetical protein
MFLNLRKLEGITVVTTNYCIYTKLDSWVNAVVFLFTDIIIHMLDIVIANIVRANNPTQELTFLLNRPNFSLTPNISFKFRTLHQQSAQNCSLYIYIISH